MERGRKIDRYASLLGVLVYGICFWSVLFYIHFYQFDWMTINMLYAMLIGLVGWFGLIFYVVNKSGETPRTKKA